MILLTVTGVHQFPTGTWRVYGACTDGRVFWAMVYPYARERS